MRSRLLLLDSCAIVNFYASTHFEALVESLNGDASLVDYVHRESQFVRTRLANGDEEREQICLDSSINRGLLRVLELGSEEEFTLFLALGVRLDDGEAATLAVAASRGGILVTDDRKALAVARELSVPSLTTPEVVQEWAVRSGLPRHTLCEAIENIRFRARYEPGKHHPLSSWWNSLLDPGHLS